MIKRRLGSALRARVEANQFREIVLRAITHNVMIVRIQVFYRAGTDHFGVDSSLQRFCPPPFDGHRLGPHFAEMCADLDCELLDLDGIASYVELGDDVEHLDETGHAAVAAAVEARIGRMLT